MLSALFPRQQFYLGDKVENWIDARYRLIA